MRKLAGTKRQNRVLAGLFLLSFLIVLTSGCETAKTVKWIAPDYFVHGPSASKQCYHCHEISRTKLKKLQQRGILNIGGAPKAGGQIPGLLLKSKKELCLDCHPPKTFRAAHWSEEPPVSEGGCIFCHDPHMSPFRYMLRKKF